MTDSKRSDVIESMALAILVAHDELWTDEESVDMYFAQQEHSGDCTKQAWTCNKCYVDMYRKQARAALSAVLDHMAEPSEGMRRAVAKNWGRRTWVEFDDVLSQYRKEALGDAE